MLVLNMCKNIVRHPSSITWYHSKTQFSSPCLPIAYHELTLLVMVYSTEQRIKLAEYSFESFNSVYICNNNLKK